MGHAEAGAHAFAWTAADTISPAGIALSRLADGRLLRVNPRFLDIVGRDETECIGRTMDEVGLVADPESLTILRRGLEQRGAAERLAMRYTLPRGGSTTALVSACLVEHAGEACLLTHLVDVTRERELRLRKRESEEKWQALLESLPEYIWTLSAEGIILDISKLPPGSTREDIIGRPHEAFVTHEDTARIQAVHANVLATGEPAAYEGLAQPRPGSPAIVFHHRVSRAMGADGRPLLLVVSTNLTQWRAMERKIETANRRAREILESTTDAFYHVDESWRFTDVNPHAERILGRSAGSLMGTSLWEAFPEAAGGQVEQALRRVAATGEAAHLEVPFASLGGWFEAHAYRTPEGVAVYFRDVTPRRLDAERLAASEARFRGIVELATEVVVLTDAALRVTYASPSVTAVLGYAPWELVGQPAYAYLHPDDAAGRPAPAPAAKAEPARFERTLRIRRKDGSHAHLEMRGVWMGAEGALAVARDVSARVELEAEQEENRRHALQREKLTALGTLVAGVAHEINNPLSYLRGGAEHITFSLDELRSDARTTAAVKEHLEALRPTEAALLRGADRIEHITRSLKRVARKPSGEREPVQLCELLESTLTVAAPRIPPHVDVVRDLREIPPIVAESSELAQVFLNLLFNAAEALADQKDARLVVRTRAERGFAIVEVADNGPGIPAAMREAMFVPFSTNKAHGTGLGLSISLGIVEAHGGTLSYETATDRGTTFRVSLPL